MSHRAVFALLVLLLSRPGLAQQPAAPPIDTAVVILRFTDGSTVTGRVVAGDDSSRTVATAAGLRVVVPLRSLAGWSPAAGPARGAEKFGRPDPNRVRLFLAPTARTLSQGGAYIGDYYLFFPVVGYGITDRITVSGGLSLLPGLRLDEQLLYLAPKVGIIQTPSFSLAAGALYMRLNWSDLLDAWGGVGYGVASFGSEDAAITVGLGWPFASGGTTTEPWAMVGGELRVSRGLKLLAEGWKFPGATEVPAVAGVRFVGEKIAVDFGLVRVLGADMTGVVPWVDFAVNW